MRVPSYRKHSSGQARVTLAGKDFLLGEYGSKASKEKYKRLLKEYEASNRSPAFGESPSKVTMSQVCMAYLNYAKEYYPVGTEYVNLELACRPIADLYAEELAHNFGPAEFKVCRSWWMDSPNRTRQYINKQAKRLLRIVKWAVAEGMIPPANYQAIKCVEPLKRGRVAAPEAKPVKPVADSVAQATLPHLSQVVADMVRFQLATGCRPGEVCSIKPSMVDRSKDVWEIRLNEHKTAWRGKERTIYCGPNAQAVLARYLLRDQDAFCFSPQEAIEQRREVRNAKRTTPLSCGNRRGKVVVSKPAKKPGEGYSTMSYGRAIKYACKKAFPAPEGYSKAAAKKWHSEHAWAPNQLRHATATKIREKFGIEAASTILGHSGLEVTQVYAEADRQKAIEVARKLG